jgi:hypothetical protein
MCVWIKGDDEALLPFEFVTRPRSALAIGSGSGANNLHFFESYRWQQ